MLASIAAVTGSIARMSALRPIHTIILVVFLASAAYLSVVNIYISDSLVGSNSINSANVYGSNPASGTVYNSASTLNYFHPPLSQGPSNWSLIDDTSSHPDAAHFYVAPLQFASNSHFAAPLINGSVQGDSPAERILISSSDNVTSLLDSLHQITADNIVWKARHIHRLSQYLESAQFAAAKLQSLIRGAESFDITLIALAYAAMIYTLVKVFVDLQLLGSNFWLAFCTIATSAVAFLFALFVTSLWPLRKVSLISLSEGIPFLVAIIGFKHKISIATWVMKASSHPIEVSTIVADAFAAHSISLLRDHVVVIGALLSITAYVPRLGGLANFCLLSALTLALDLLLLLTFFAAVLALKVELNRARRSVDLKAALEEDGISSLVASQVAAALASSKSRPQSRRLGLSFAPLKFVTIASFVALHVFYMGGTWLYSGPSHIPKAAPQALFSSLSDILSNAAALEIPIASCGTIVTVYTPRVYMPKGAYIQAEDFVWMALDLVSTAIKDNLISKFLLFAFALSICANAYFLNANRYQVSATNKLIAQELARPKQKRLFVASASALALAHASLKADLTSLPSPPEDLGSVTDSTTDDSDSGFELAGPVNCRPVTECLAIMKAGNLKSLADAEVASLVVAGNLPLYALEKQLADNARAVNVRRKAIAKLANAPVLDTKKLPFQHYDYDRVFGACCENVIGYMPLPVGVAGPLLIDDVPYHIPMATTEGCLVASTMRGCKAINAGGGVQTVLTQDGMTRGPCVSFPSLKRAGAAKLWLDSVDGQRTIKKAFNSTSRFARLQHIHTAMAGTLLFIRFRTTTGDAMGMNMISKGVEYSLKHMVEECGWHDMDVVSVSGNYCTDKKPAAINWIEGRGKSIVAEARVPASVVQSVLKLDVAALVELNISKNLIGSAMAGLVGGFNAHAANLVTAVFLACGQDPAQNVESSNCITLMNKLPNGDLQVLVSMPSIEVGTIGGGTVLEPQGAMLELLGVRGPHPTTPGANAQQLARIVASAVLAAELSLCAALAAGHLVQSHMQHNRAAPTPAATGAANGDTKDSSSKCAASDVERLKEGSVTCIKS